jgi:hypothetical protein
MYRHLWTIGPKEAMESMDYSFKEHFGKDLPTYVPREIIKLYLEGIFTCTIFIYSKLSDMLVQNVCKKYSQYVCTLCQSARYNIM